MKIKTYIAIVIPAYNEEKNILELIKNIRKVTDAKIIIVDDSSHDKTKKIVKSYKIKNLIFYHRKKKSGRGSAVLFGFKKILQSRKKFNCIIEMDADMSHNPNELLRNISYFKRNSLDLLIASRYLKNSNIIGWPLSRKFLSMIANILAKNLLRAGVSDYTNGYRFYSHRAVKVIVSNYKKFSSDFIILSEIIIVLKNKKYLINEINTIFKNRSKGESSVNLKLIFLSLAGLLKLFFKKKLN